MTIEVNTFYTYKDKLYRVVLLGKSKINGEWVESVTYTNHKSEYFTRTLDDFESKFTWAKRNFYDAHSFIIYGLLGVDKESELAKNVGDIDYARMIMSLMSMPATFTFDLKDLLKEFPLYCKYYCSWNKVISISRLGDVFLSEDFDSDSYDKRVSILECSEFTGNRPND